MEKLKDIFYYWVAVGKLTEAQFFSMVAKFYHYFFEDVGPGDNDD